MGFKNFHEQYRAARKGVALKNLSDRAILKFTGDDRVSFLHGMVTQDVKGLKENQAAYTALLNVKGGMVADGKITRLSTCLLLDTEPGSGPRVKEMLEKFIIADDVEVVDASEEYSLIQLWGPQAAALAGLIQAQVILVLNNPLGRVPRVDLLLARATQDAAYTQIFEQGKRFGLALLSPEVAEMIRVEEGIPLHGPDLTESTLPLEANLDRAISYNKGCYIGQEVIARATFRGQVNWRLTGFTLEAQPGLLPIELKIADRKVGWISSVVQSPAFEHPIALGYLHRNHLEVGRAIPLASSTALATVHALPFF